MSISPLSQSSRNRAALKPKPRVQKRARHIALHLCPDMEMADTAREVVDLAILTQRSGERAFIASSGGSLVTESERAAVRHRRVPLDDQGLFVDWRNRARLSTLIQRERPTLLHAHGVEVLSVAYGLSRAHHLPLVADLTQPLPDQPRYKQLAMRLRSISCLVRVPSQYMKMELEQKFGFSPDAVRLVPPGVDLQWHKADAISPERLQGLSRSWRLPEPTTVVLLPMPLHPGLGHDIFLEALASIKEENIFAVLIGSDRHSPGMRLALESQIQRLGLNGKVVMPESCSDWPTAFWLANIVVAPNVLPRGQNRALLAAQAMGRPVIVSDTGANREMVKSGATAWVTQPGDVQALAAALRQAAHLTTDQRLALADTAREFIAENFPQKGWFDGTIELYEDVSQQLPAQAKAA